MQVLGIEKFGVAHDRGSSHGESRIIRLAYHEHPDYVPLLKRAWDLWKDLERKAGQVQIASLLTESKSHDYTMDLCRYK